jgi:hypothetical protein
MNELLTIWGVWLILDVIAMELISRRKNGMNDIYDLYDDWGKLQSVATKIYVIFHLMLFLPFTIPASIYKIIKKKKDE